MSQPFVWHMIVAHCVRIIICVYAGASQPSTITINTTKDTPHILRIINIIIDVNSEIAGQFSANSVMEFL